MPRRPSGLPDWPGLPDCGCITCWKVPRNFLLTRGRSFSAPWVLAFVGAIIGGFFALLLLAKRFKISPLLMLDAASPAAAIGYGIGRIGCMLSGDGDYGIATNLPWGISFPPVKDGSLILLFLRFDHGAASVPRPADRAVGGTPLDAIVRVHPTPIYEFLVAVVIFWMLWKLGAWALKTHALPNGMVFAASSGCSRASPGFSWKLSGSIRARFSE